MGSLKVPEELGVSWMHVMMELNRQLRVVFPAGSSVGVIRTVQ